MLILSLQHIPKAKDTRFHNWTLSKFEAEATSLRPRPIEGPETEIRGYEAEAQAKIFALRPVWLRGFNIALLIIVYIYLRVL